MRVFADTWCAIALSVAWCVSGAIAQCEPGWVRSEGIPGIELRGHAVMPWDPDGDGPATERLVISGWMWTSGDTVASNIASGDGESWEPIGNGINGPVLALAMYNGELIAGGSFTVMGGGPGNYIARWDGAAWQPLGAGLNAAPHALLVKDGELVAGGEFTSAGGASANYIARWNGVSWSRFGTGMNQPIEALAVHQGELIAGGAFTTADGASANRVARWDGAAWRAMSVGFQQAVRALHVWNGSLYAGRVGVTGCVARWDNGWWPVGVVAGSVHWFGEYNGELVAGGDFEISGTAGALNIASWNGSAWRALGSGIGTLGSPDYLNDGAVYREELIVTGDFGSAGGVGLNNIAAWNGGGWRAIAPGIDDDVSAVAVFGGEVFAAGRLSHAGGVQASRIARWDGLTWRTVGGGLGGQANISYVYALTEFHGDLIAGGSFTTADGADVDRIARWDGSAWHALGSGLNGPNTPVVFAMTIYQNELVVGGVFTLAGGVQAQRVARWDGNQWRPFGNGAAWGGNASSVEALTVFNGELIAGGDFDIAGGTATLNIARWNAAASRWEPLGSGMNNDVTALTVFDGQLIAGGVFSTAGGVPARRVARWDGTAWHAMGTGLSNGATGRVAAFTMYDGKLVAGGSFGPNTGAPAEGIAEWVPATSEWRQLGTGVRGNVYGLAQYHGELVMGGTFDRAGGAAAGRFARWSATNTPWVAREPSDIETPCGGDASLRVEVATGYEVTYRWRRDGVELSDGTTGTGSVVSGAASAQLTITGVSSADEGVYDCVIGGACADVVSNSAVVSVECCAADFDEDGFLSGADFDLYVQAFEAGELSADFDGDGFLSGADFDLYVLSFEEGC